MLTLLPIITHYLSPAEYGNFVLAQVWTMFLIGIANFGLTTGYERNFFDPIYKGVTHALLYSSLVFVGSNMLVLLFILWVFQAFFHGLIFTDLAVNHMLVLVFIGTACNSLAQYYLIYFKNVGLAHRYILFVLMQAISNFIITLILLTYYEFREFSLVYGWLISNILLLLSLFMSYIFTIRFSFDLGLLKSMLKISLPLTPKIFIGAISTHIDKMMIGAIGSTTAVGIYQVGQTLALMIFQFMTGLYRVFQPELYKKLFASKHHTDKYEINNYITPFFFMSALVALIVGLFAAEVATILFDEKYARAQGVIIVLSFYYFLLFFGMILPTQLVHAKKSAIMLLILLLNALINIGLNVIMIPKFGIMGAAWSSAITGIIVLCISFYYAHKYNPVYWNYKVIAMTYIFFIFIIVIQWLKDNNMLMIGDSWFLYSKFLLIFAFVFTVFQNTTMKTITKRYLIRYMYK